MNDWVTSLREEFGGFGVVAVPLLAALVALAVHAIAYAIAKRITARTDGVGDSAAVARTRRPAAFFLALGAVQIVLPSLGLSADRIGAVRHGIAIALIVTITWLLVRLLDALEVVVAERFRVDVADNLDARRIHTQIRVLRRVTILVLLILGLAAVLMTFPNVRQLGAGLMASAGVAGLVIGMAARPFLSNVVAGVQIALAQPIRLDDVLIVEGEWGRVEEITATYVVVALWDDRRLIVPLNYFQERPFQSWTRTRSQLLGTAFLYVDYTAPVDAVRAELKRVLDGTDLWDGRAWALQVTNATERTLELRALMSAADAGKAFELRCLVRETLVAFLQREHPGSLPRTRAVIDAARSDGDALRSGGAAVS